MPNPSGAPAAFPNQAVCLFSLCRRAPAGKAYRLRRNCSADAPSGKPKDAGRRNARLLTGQAVRGSITASQFRRHRRRPAIALSAAGVAFRLLRMVRFNSTGFAPAGSVRTGSVQPSHWRRPVLASPPVMIAQSAYREKCLDYPDRNFQRYAQRQVTSGRPGHCPRI